MPTPEECKKAIFHLGIKHGVPPRLISLRLLSDNDKSDMLEGKIEISSLNESVEVWRDNGMPDYAHGKTESYESEKKRAKYAEIRTNNDHEDGVKLRPGFMDYRVTD